MKIYQEQSKWSVCLKIILNQNILYKRVDHMSLLPSASWLARGSTWKQEGRDSLRERVQQQPITGELFSSAYKYSGLCGARVRARSAVYRERGETAEGTVSACLRVCVCVLDDGVDISPLGFSLFFPRFWVRMRLIQNMSTIVEYPSPECLSHRVLKIAVLGGSGVGKTGKCAS